MAVNRWAHLVLAAAAAVVCLVALAADGTLPASVRFESAALWLLCLWPSVAYIQRPAVKREPLPFLPLFGIVYGAYFAIPLAFGLTDLGGFGSYIREQDYADAADAAMLGWLGLLAATHAWDRRRETVTRGGSMLNSRILMRWAIGLTWLSATFALVQIADFLPAVLYSAILFVNMLGWFGLSLGVLLAVRGYGRPADHVFLVGGGLASGLSILVSGAVSGFLLLIVVVSFALWSGRGHFKRYEIVMGGVFLLSVISLKAIVPDFRAEAWYSGQQLSIFDRLSLINSLVSERVEEGGGEALILEGRDRSAVRSAAADLLADVIQRTPSEIPYWRGGSYVSLVGALVPRIFWPDKPEKDLGGRFGKRYNYISIDNNTTSINFPWLVEIYANFGMRFMAVGGAIIGSILALLGRLLNRPGQSDLWTAAGIALLVPLYNIESDFSLIYGGLILYGGAVYVVVRVIEHTCRVSNVAPQGYAHLRPVGPLHPVSQ